VTVEDDPEQEKMVLVRPRIAHGVPGSRSASDGTEPLVMSVQGAELLAPLNELGSWVVREGSCCGYGDEVGCASCGRGLVVVQGQHAVHGAMGCEQGI